MLSPGKFPTETTAQKTHQNMQKLHGARYPAKGEAFPKCPRICFPLAIFAGGGHTERGIIYWNGLPLPGAWLGQIDQ